MTKGRILSVANKEGQPLIELLGADLEKSGFNSGDIVSVKFDENIIIICKNQSTNILQDLERKNPSIKKLISEFNLELMVG